MKKPIEPLERTPEVSWYGAGWFPTTTRATTPPDLKHTQGPHVALAPKEPALLKRVGVVVGPFNPPHVGHRYLVEQAFSQCGLLYVTSPFKRDGVDELFHQQLMFRAFSDLAQVHMLRNDGRDFTATAVTVRELAKDATHLFSSDENPEGAAALAQELGVEHVVVDAKRTVFPISATDIRKDIYGRFQSLAPHIRDLFALHVVIVGAEGSGKSTLARELKAHFRAGLVEDSLFQRVQETGQPPNQRDFANMIEGAAERRQAVAVKSESGVLIVDDSMRLARAYAKRFGVELSAANFQKAVAEPADLWLMCHNDFPFPGPPERDDPAGRAQIEATLSFSDRRDVIHVRGEGRHRIDVAADAVRAALEEKRAGLMKLLGGIEGGAGRG